MEIIRSFDCNDQSDAGIKLTFKFDTGREQKIELNLAEWREMWKLITTGQFQPWKRERKDSVVSDFFCKSEKAISYFRRKYENEDVY